MTKPEDIIDKARIERFSGKIEVEMYFGQVKKVHVGTRIDLDAPVDMSRFKQIKPDPFKKVVGQ